MLPRIVKLLVVVAVALFSLRASAHQVECYKEAGLVQLDGQGNVVLGQDGLPVFLSSPATVLSIDAYPAAIGWRIRVDNLVASHPSMVAAFDDPHLLGNLAGKQVFGTLPAPDVEIAVGGSIVAVVVERIASYAQCASDPNPGLVDNEGAPICRDLRENVALVSTYGDATGCRARIECKPQR